jgi:hypothetical protein
VLVERKDLRNAKLFFSRVAMTSLHANNSTCAVDVALC